MSFQVEILMKKAGERVNLETYKKNVNDFTLWKPSNNGEPGWESPWGVW